VFANLFGVAMFGLLAFSLFYFALNPLNCDKKYVSPPWAQRSQGILRDLLRSTVKAHAAWCGVDLR